jgi:hypothetical protein
MDLDFEQRIVHSAAFGASTVFCFVSQYAKAREPNQGPELPLLHIVLPLAFHRPSANAIERCNYAGGLLRALDRAPDLAAGLSARVQDLSRMTWASINLACASGLLSVEPTPTWPVFLPARESLPRDLRPSETHLKAVHSAARRLGHWTAQETREAIWAYLDLRF